MFICHIYNHEGIISKFYFYTLIITIMWFYICHILNYMYNKTKKDYNTLISKNKNDIKIFI